MSTVTDAAVELLSSAVADAADELIGSGRTPGVAVALEWEGHRWSGGFGHADLETRRPMTSDTVTRAASVTKMYTAIAVLQLVEAGAIGLDQPIRELLPELPLDNPRGDRAVTVRDLLTYRSGLTPDIGGVAVGRHRELHRHVADVFAAGHVAELGAAELWSAAPGERFQYSNLGVALLGLLVERVNPDALGFARYVQEAILDPLAMRSSELPPHLHAARPDLLRRLAAGYCAFRSAYVRTPLVQVHCAPACGLLTTAADHLRLLGALAGGGRRDGAQILSERSIALMTTPAAPETGWTVGVGTTLMRAEQRTRWFGHSGVHPWGWTTDSRVYPQLGLSLVVCCNAVEMTAWHEGALCHPAAFVCDVTSAALVAARQPPRTWAWRVSRTAGLLLSDRMQLLGLAPLDADAANRLADGVATGDARGWDRDGFCDGLLAAGSTMQQSRDDTTPELLAAAWQSLGGRYPDLPAALWRCGRG